MERQTDHVWWIARLWLSARVSRRVKRSGIVAGLGRGMSEMPCRPVSEGVAVSFGVW